jgi:PqqD family protein of HPr-rel-A system
MTSSNRLHHLALSDSGFVFDPHSGATFTVNATGLYTLKALRDGLEPAAIASALEREYDAPDADLRRDVDEFVQLLTQSGILDGRGDA